MEDYGLRFRKELEDLVNQIPEGTVARISDIARAMGDIRAVRAIASMLPELSAPYWRVVREDMSIIHRRISEEVRVEGDRAIGEIFRDFRGGGILRELRKEQEVMRKSISLEDSEFRTIAGVDVAYIGELAFVGIALYDVGGMHLRDYVHETTIRFPYIPTYLSYREGPAIIEAVESAPFSPEALMVDGNGIIHPEHLGIASYLGIKLGIPTIGVAKSLLCGKVEWMDDRKGRVMVEGEHVGYALIGGKAKKPVYVSPGHMISVEKARRIAERFMTRRVPEPTRRAHIIAGEFRDRFRETEMLG